jgi:hypothetical protein
VPRVSDEWQWMVEELGDVCGRKQAVLADLLAAPRGSVQFKALADQLLALDERERQLHRALIEAIG